MDKDLKDLGLFKTRSVGASIRDGYRLYMDNFRKIFRATWLMAVGYALYSGIFTTILVNLHRIIRLYGLPFQFYNGVLVALLLSVVANALLAAFGFSLLRQHRETGNIVAPTRWYGYCDKRTLGRTLRAAFAFLALGMGCAVIVYFIGKGVAPYLSEIALSALLFVFCLILLPIVAPILPCLLYYVLSGDKASLFGRKFPLRYWGGAILTCLIVGIVSGLLILITELPANILMSAYSQSVMGTMRGDPSGMPDYMLWLNLIVFTLAGFIRAYINLSTIFPFYYFCGSVETREKERAEMAQKFKDA